MTANPDTPEARRLRALCAVWAEMEGSSDVYSINRTRLMLADLRVRLEKLKQLEEGKQNV